MINKNFNDKWIQKFINLLQGFFYAQYCPFGQEDERKMLPVSLDQLYASTEYEMSDEADLEEDLIKQEMLKELHAALDELEEMDRTIMKMFGDGATEKQIAEVVHLSQKGVNKKKKRVFVQLKTRLKDFE